MLHVAQLVHMQLIVTRARFLPPAVHHKFAILDSRMVANGSFNWTRQAVLFNQENVVLSDNPALVRPCMTIGISVTSQKRQTSMLRL
jgi:phosphatidylserine/phosphatidylglycerophosphate/cardiolipin synthase-like enzyme